MEATPPMYYSQPQLHEGVGGRGWSKYGTMSGGSALSKSMKYAESWLYGSMALRQPDWQQASLFGTVRAPRARPRPRLPEDPYDLVRQSRMGRAKSTSPPRRKSILESTVSPYELMDRVPAKVSLAGQTIKLQESSSESEWSSSETLIPRLTPRRPPRKKEEKPEIKSILKKPEQKKKPDKRSSFRDFKHKKKKQVQFRDAETKKKDAKEAKESKELRKLDARPEVRIEPKPDLHRTLILDSDDSEDSLTSAAQMRSINERLGFREDEEPRINDTMRLRARNQRRDARSTFEGKRGERALSPGRPRPKEPPPPPPPPSKKDPSPQILRKAPSPPVVRKASSPPVGKASSPPVVGKASSPPIVGKASSVAGKASPSEDRKDPPPMKKTSPPIQPNRPPAPNSNGKGPPPPPPRQIFPFTKEQIEKLNHNRTAEYIPTKILTIEPNYQNFQETKEEKPKRAITPPQLIGESCVHVNGVKLSIPPPEDTADNRTIVTVDTPPPDLTTSITINDSLTPKTTSVVIGEPFVNKVTININGHDDRVSIEPLTSNVTVGETTRIVVESVKTKGEIEMEELIRKQVDPVEAARNNLIPHICGKDSTTSYEETTSDVEKTCSEMSSDLSSDSYKSALDFATKEEIDNQTEQPNVEQYPEKDKLEDELEIRIGVEEFEENHYETIKDPIYEEISGSDEPPPLPLSPPPPLIELGDEHIPTKSIFEGATKYDIISYLVGAKRRGIVGESLPEELSCDSMSPSHSRISSLDLSSGISHLSNASDSSEESCLILPPSDVSSLLNERIRKGSAEIERNDSGVGSETSRSRWQHISGLREDQQHSCEDCDQIVETQITQSGVMFAPLVCRKCSKRRAERREIITEIVETEEKYGRDLRIILEEFYKPMQVAGLLSSEQLSAIFLNTEELLEHNCVLAEKLRDALEIAIEQGDEDLLTVNVGSIFIEAAPMLHAFESYCTRQGAASLLLANLEKEKELLRIFLRVSQMENSVLRRMNLNSFLMVPVQRITKYPLLLSRLYKVTPSHIVGKEAIKEAQHNIELHLEHINYLAKDISTSKLWRRISITNGRRGNDEADMVNIKLRKIAVDVLEWTHDEVRFAVEGKLLYTQPTDGNWKRRATIKLSPVNALLVTLGKPNDDYQPDGEDPLVFPRNTGIRTSTLVLMKEKGGRYSLLREPLFLDRCIVCTEADIEDYFEVQELPTKDSYIFKAEDGEMTRRWYRQLQYHAQGAGTWRRRRNALANIMINGMINRT